MVLKRKAVKVITVKNDLTKVALSEVTAIIIVINNNGKLSMTSVKNDICQKKWHCIIWLLKYCLTLFYYTGTAIFSGVRWRKRHKPGSSVLMYLLNYLGTTNHIRDT